MRNLVNLLAGLIFGLGLLISGMANPAKVQNFLDLAGSFDPSLIFVMAGAVLVTFAGYCLVLSQPKPLLAERFRLPAAKDIDARLLGGATLFGIGWGLSGFCPGPAMVSLPLLAKSEGRKGRGADAIGIASADCTARLRKEFQASDTRARKSTG